MLEEILRQGLAELGLPCGETALRRFRLYYEHLEQQSRLMNLNKDPQYKERKKAFTEIVEPTPAPSK